MVDDYNKLERENKKLIEDNERLKKRKDNTNRDNMKKILII